MKSSIANTIPKTFVDYVFDLYTKKSYKNGVFFSDGSQMNESVAGGLTDIEKYKMMYIFFDPMKSNGAAETAMFFDYIELSTEMDDMSETLPITDITVLDESISFDKTQQLYEQKIGYKLYDALNADNVDEYVGCTTESGASVTGMRYKEVTDGKIVDIAAKANDGTMRSYRIVLTSLPRPENPTEIEAECVVGSNGIDCTGLVTAQDSRIVSIKVINKDDGNKILWAGVVTSDKDGNFTKFLGIHESMVSSERCTVEILFDAKGMDEPYAVEKTFVKMSAAQDKVSGLRAAANAIDYVMEDNSADFEKLGVWVKEYKSASTEVQEDIATALESVKSQINAENAAKTINGIYLMKMLPTLSDKEASALIKRFDEEVSELSINLSKTDGDKKTFAQFSESEREWIVKFVFDNTTHGSVLSNFSAFETWLKKGMVLSCVNTMQYTELKNLFLGNTTVLENNLSGLEKASNLDLQGITKNSKKNPYTDIPTLVEDICDLLKPTQQGGGSSGGGGGGSTNMGTVEIPKNDTEEEVLNEELFVDLNGFDWAKNELEELYKLGVINGVGNKCFAPSKNVTREEFVKLISKAFSLEEKSGKTSFADVNMNEWYAPYIYTGVSAGIINGISETMFGVGNNITREDMAVIIYRTLKNYGKELNVGQSDFADEAEIADYAKEAVEALYGAGVINGVGESRFSPKTYASRAEASVIIYRCVKGFAL